MQLRHRLRSPVLLLLGLLLLSGCKVLGMRTIPLDELKESYESSTSRYMTVDGTDVHYRVEGNMEGPTVVLLHGVLASLHTWDGWVEHLKPHFRIVRLDLPGFGLTGPMANKDYTPEYAVEIFEKMRVQLDRQYGGFDKVHLIGNSLGGFISWYYATQFPQHVDKLVLIDPIAYPQPVPFIIRFAARPFFGWVAIHQSPRFIIKRNLRQVYGDSDRVTDATIDRYFELLCREGNRESMVDYFRTLIKYNHDPKIAAAVPNIKAPTLLMWGEKDRWVPPALIERWQQDVPGIEVRVIDTAGHVPMEELPDETVRYAYAFITGKELPKREEAPIDAEDGPVAPPRLDDEDEPDQEAGFAAPSSGGEAPDETPAEPPPAATWESENETPAAPPPPAPKSKPKASSGPSMADW